MWNDRLRLAARVESDWRALTDVERDAAAVALQKIDDDPIVGAPLKEPLRGIWSYRVGNLRILYRLAPEARVAVILKIQSVEETRT